MKRSISKTMILDASQKDKIISAEAIWMFKVAEQDYSLRSCDGVPKLFETMFSDSNIGKGFTMSTQKTLHIVFDGVGPLNGKRLCNDIASSEGIFTVLFDETMTVQNKKQTDVLIPYWNKSEGLIVTQYLISFFFGRATGDYIVDLFLQLQEDENKQKYPLPWDALADLSSDGPNINHKQWRLLDTKLKEMGHNGLLPFISCTIHVVHNAFHKGRRSRFTSRCGRVSIRSPCMA